MCVATVKGMTDAEKAAQTKVTYPCAPVPAEKTTALASAEAAALKDKAAMTTTKTALDAAELLVSATAIA